MVKHGGNSIMLWSCLLTKRIGRLQKIDTRMNIIDYFKLLHYKLYSMLIDFDFDLDEIVSQQNKCFCSHKIVFITTILYNEVAAQSADLNSIQHVCTILKWLLNSYFTTPKNVHEL